MSGVTGQVPTESPKRSVLGRIRGAYRGAAHVESDLRRSGHSPQGNDDTARPSLDSLQLHSFTTTVNTSTGPAVYSLRKVGEHKARAICISHPTGRHSAARRMDTRHAAKHVAAKIYSALKTAYVLSCADSDSSAASRDGYTIHTQGGSIIAVPERPTRFTEISARSLYHTHPTRPAATKRGQRVRSVGAALPVQQEAV